MFLGALLFAYTLGPENYGHFSLIQVTALLFTTFCALSLGQMSTKIVAEALAAPKGQLACAFSVAYGSAFALSLPLVVLIALLGKWLAITVGGTEQLALPYIASSVLVFAGFLVSVQNGILLAINKTKAQALINACAAPVALSILAIAAIQNNLLAAIIGYGVSQLIFVAAQEFVLWRYRVTAEISLSLHATTAADWSVLWKLGIPSSIAGLFSVIATWISLVLLSESIDGISAVGHFSLGNQARMMVLFGVGVVANAALPLLASAGVEKNHDQSRAVTTQSTIVVTVTAATVAVLLTIGAFALVPIFLPDYIESLLPLAWLLGSVVIMAPTSIMMRKATANFRPRILLVGNMVYALVLVATAATAIRSGFGATGLAVAYFVAATIQLAAYCFLNKVNERMP